MIMSEKQTKTRYVLGFLFRESREAVVLIRKEKPQWQAGLLNGVGGKIESGETPVQAMVRECTEETGAATFPDGWREFCVMEGPTWEVICFETTDECARLAARTRESEVVEKVKIKELQPKECVSNLLWLLYLALDENGGCPPVANIEYPSEISEQIK